MTVKKAPRASAVVMSVVAAIYAQAVSEARAATEPSGSSSATNNRNNCNPNSYEPVVSGRDFVLRMPCGQKAQLEADFVQAVRTAVTKDNENPRGREVLPSILQKVKRRVDMQMSFISFAMMSTLLLPEGEDKQDMSVEMGVDAGGDINTYYRAKFSCERYEMLPGKITIDCRAERGELMKLEDVLAGAHLFAPPTEEEIRKMPVWTAPQPADKGPSGMN